MQQLEQSNYDYDSAGNSSEHNMQIGGGQSEKYWKLVFLPKLHEKN